MYHDLLYAPTPMPAAAAFAQMAGTATIESIHSLCRAGGSGLLRSIFLYTRDLI